MPIYDYACDKCGREFEVEQRITDERIKTCPHCRSRKVRRLISQTSFVLKGGGWYSDLYSSSGKAKKDDAGSSKDASPADSSKSDSGGTGDKGDKGGKGKGDAGGSKKKSKGSKAAA